MLPPYQVQELRVPIPEYLKANFGKCLSRIIQCESQAVRSHTVWGIEQQPFPVQTF